MNIFRKKKNMEAEDFSGNVKTFDNHKRFVIPEGDSSVQLIVTIGYLRDIKQWMNKQTDFSLCRTEEIRKWKDIVIEQRDEIRRLKVSNDKKHKDFQEFSRISNKNEDSLRKELEALKSKSNQDEEIESLEKDLADMESSLKNKLFDVTKHDRELGEKHKSVVGRYKKYICIVEGFPAEYIESRTLQHLEDLAISTKKEKENFARKIKESEDKLVESEKAGGAEPGLDDEVEESNDDDSPSDPNPSSPKLRASELRIEKLRELQDFKIEDTRNMESSFCYCRQIKAKTAKSCDEHWRRAKSISTSQKIGMPEAHQIAFEEYRVGLQ